MQIDRKDFLVNKTGFFLFDFFPTKQQQQNARGLFLLIQICKSILLT